jgi:lactoylglutathione lyase
MSAELRSAPAGEKKNVRKRKRQGGSKMRYGGFVLLVAVLLGVTPRIVTAGDEVGSIGSLGHVGVAVSDLQVALHFYVDQLGFKEAFRLKRPDGTPVLVYLRVGDSNSFVELFPGTKAPGTPPLPQAYHLGLIVKDLQATLHRLEARGYPLPADAYKQAAKLQIDNTYLYFIKDPDGNRIELSQMTPESLEHKSGAEVTAGKP